MSTPTRYRAMLARRKALLVPIQGRMVAVDPRCPHGTRYGYTGWLCRCVRCSDANTEYDRHYTRVARPRTAARRMPALHARTQK